MTFLTRRVRLSRSPLLVAPRTTRIAQPRHFTQHTSRVAPCKSGIGLGHIFSRKDFLLYKNHQSLVSYVSSTSFDFRPRTHYSRIPSFTMPFRTPYLLHPRPPRSHRRALDYDSVNHFGHRTSLALIIYTPTVAHLTTIHHISPYFRRCTPLPSSPRGSLAGMPAFAFGSLPLFPPIVPLLDLLVIIYLDSNIQAFRLSLVKRYPCPSFSPFFFAGVLLRMTD